LARPWPLPLADTVEDNGDIVLVTQDSRVRPAVVAAIAAVALLWGESGGGAQGSADATEKPARPPFNEWVSAFREEALSRGLSAATLDAALGGLEPLAIVVERDRTQAETVLSIERYMQRRLTRPFVRTAQQRATEHRALLNRVASRYHVQPRFIVAIWGMESNFGRFSGVRPIVQALATLAWEGRREALFRGELFAALEILDRGYIDPPALKGSWAGAMGQTQFMPSSYLKYAADFDEDGHRDIWKSTGDVFASIANYLAEHGWREKETWGREVRLPAGGWRAMIEKVGARTTGCRAHREMTAARPMSRWQALGVRSVSGGALPRVDRTASLVSAGRRTFLVYGNYEALLDYNCAHPYALTVAMLADRIGG
jgi:membrane-bound lytic murein transglycosylase B